MIIEYNCNTELNDLPIVCIDTQILHLIWIWYQSIDMCLSLYYTFLHRLSHYFNFFLSEDWATILIFVFQIQVQLRIQPGSSVVGGTLWCCVVHAMEPGCPCDWSVLLCISAYFLFSFTNYKLRTHMKITFVDFYY